MKRKIKKYHLDFEKTILYFLEQVGSGETLSEVLVEKKFFNQGHFYTILPENIEINKIYDFESGIISPVAYGNQEYYVKDYGFFHPQQVVTMDEDFSGFISMYLKNSDCSAVFDNFYLEPHRARIENVKMIPYDNEVYFILEKENLEKDIYKTIRKCNHLWHFLCILTSFQIDPFCSTLSKHMLNEICKYAHFVVGGAYDGEGYIFWSRDTC